ncbi:hypothetical protein K9B35_00305 [Sphingomonas sp. R647]|uniref:hypothetical protein n=1 Tax=Sphingomonas sp. R647 TaxID=2875233 RepID=UPI001CD5E0F7|nr:hypothetical protein [Sphingomonas sp. R647]MCA1196396.1 hypothetical protein [Sphingomonas sp. R647]
MAYSESRGPSWVSIAGFVVWVVAGFLMFSVFFDSFAAHCISDDCSPSLEIRILGAAFAAFVIGGMAGWVTTTLLKQAFQGRTS